MTNYGPAGEGAQVEAWEADFLNDVHQIRQLKAEMTLALQQVSPNPKLWILNSTTLVCTRFASSRPR